MLMPYLINPLPASYPVSAFWAGLASLATLALLPATQLPRIFGFAALLFLPSVLMAFEQGTGLQLSTWLLIAAMLILISLNLPDPAKEVSYSVFLGMALLWSFLGLIVWNGWTGAFALHIGDWAMTTERQSALAGPFINRNVYAGITLGAFIIALRQWLKNQNGFGIWFFLSALLGGLCLSTSSRSVFMLFLLLMLLAAVVLLQRKQYAKAALLGLLCGISLLIANQIISIEGEQGGLQLRFNQTVSEGLGARKVIWSSAIYMWLDHPVFGVGIGEFGAHYLEEQAKARSNHEGLPPGRGPTTSAHNLLLHLMAEAGISGAIFWTLISIFLARKFFRSALKPEEPLWPALIFCCTLWAQSLFNLTLTEPYSMIIFCFFLGYLIHNEQNIHVDKYRSLIFVLLFSAIVVQGITAYRTVSFWNTFEIWLKSDDPRKKKQLASRMLENDAQMPYFVDLVARRVVNRPRRHAQLPALAPWIDKALMSLQMPGLYQAKFLILLHDDDYKAACQMGQFLLLQQWERDPNSLAYKMACKQQKPARFRAAW